MEVTVSVIDGDRGSGTFHTVIATVGLGAFPVGLALTRDGTRAYVVAMDSHHVAGIDTGSNVAMPVRIAVRETSSRLIAISPDETRAYVTNARSRDVLVIDTDPQSATFHAVLLTIPVNRMPGAVVIGPPPPPKR